MNELLQGFLQFRAWLPEPLVNATDPSGQIDGLFVRTLLTLAVALFLWSFCARTLWATGLWLRDLLAGRRLVVQVATPMAWIAWLVGAVAATLPWLAIWLTHRNGHIAWGLISATFVLALVWAVLRIGERDRVYLQPALDCIVVTRALPGLRVAEHRIPLDVLLAEAPSTSQADAQAFLLQQLGSPRAVERYLRVVQRKRRRTSAVSG